MCNMGLKVTVRIERHQPVGPEKPEGGGTLPMFGYMGATEGLKS